MSVVDPSQKCLPLVAPITPSVSKQPLSLDEQVQQQYEQIQQQREKPSALIKL